MMIHNTYTGFQLAAPTIELHLHASCPTYNTDTDDNIPTGYVVHKDTYKVTTKTQCVGGRVLVCKGAQWKRHIGLTSDGLFVLWACALLHMHTLCVVVGVDGGSRCCFGVGMDKRVALSNKSVRVVPQSMQKHSIPKGSLGKSSFSSPSSSLANSLRREVCRYPST